MPNSDRYADQADWIQAGIDRGWISAPFCLSHDGVPTATADLDENGDLDWDACIHLVRLLPDGVTWASLDGGRQSYGEWRPTLRLAEAG